MISCCGMNCLNCEAYIATKENDDAKRKEIAANWSIRYSAEILQEQVNCTGCKSEDIKFFFTENMCPIRKCNIEKGTDNCAKCSEYKCETLSEFIKMAPEIGEALETLKVA